MCSYYSSISAFTKIPYCIAPFCQVHIKNLPNNYKSVAEDFTIVSTKTACHAWVDTSDKMLNNCYIQNVFVTSRLICVMTSINYSVICWILWAWYDPNTVHTSK